MQKYEIQITINGKTSVVGVIYTREYAEQIAEQYRQQGFEVDVNEIGEMSDVVSLTEAANLLGVSRQRVHILLQNGQLDGYKVGNTWNIYRASVERRMEQNAL